MSAINLKAPPRATFDFGAFVTAVAVAGDQAGFGLGDGTVRLVTLGATNPEPQSVALHGGALLSLAADDSGFVTGGDDGAVRRLAVDGTVATLAEHKGQWIEHVASGSDGQVAYAVGRDIHIVGADGQDRVLGKLPSTAAGLDRNGDLVAAAHYNGVTIWDVGDVEPAPRSFTWKGSHIAVSLSPDRRFVATSMQDGEVHAWRLANGTEMRMSGYPAKVKSLSWSHDTTLLATSGSEALIAWPFDGAGPEGREPLAIADAKGALATRAACHPSLPLIAGGYASGWISLTDGATKRGARFQVSRGAAISMLAWSPDGAHLLAGAEDGKAAIFSDASMRT